MFIGQQALACSRRRFQPIIAQLENKQALQCLVRISLNT